MKQLPASQNGAGLQTSIARLKVCKTNKNISKTIILVTFLVNNLANQSAVGAQANGNLYTEMRVKKRPYCGPIFHSA